MNKKETRQLNQFINLVVFLSLSRLI